MIDKNEKFCYDVDRKLETALTNSIAWRPRKGSLLRFIAVS